jgi:hypothetical protein
MTSSERNGAAQPFRFEEVARSEREEINRARGEAGLPPAKQFAGLAFSGGGIRSATFNLGVIQALARLRFLGSFDYLSTVSGGGYIGSWLSALIKREGNGSLGKRDGTASVGGAGGSERSPDLQQKLAAELGANGEAVEHHAIKFLRRYSNYLTPRLGLFSGDSLTFLTTALRNLYLNLTVLVLMASAVLLLPRLLVRFGAMLEPHYWTSAIAGVFFLIMAIVLIAFNFGLEAKKLPQKIGKCEESTTNDAMPAKPSSPWYSHTWSVLAFIVFPITLAAFVMSWLALEFASEAIAYSLWWWFLAGAVLYLLAWIFGYLFMIWASVSFELKVRKLTFRALKSQIKERSATREDRESWWTIVLSALFSGVVAGALFYLFVLGIPWLEGTAGSHALPLLVIGFGTPLLMKIYSLVVALHIGLAKHGFTEDQREWWSRLGAWVLIVGLAWAALFAVALLGPPLWGALWGWAQTWLIGGGGALWLATTIAGVWFGNSARTTGKERGWRDWIAVAAPYVFIGGLVIALSIALHELLNLSATNTCVLPDDPGFADWIQRETCRMNAIDDRVLIIGFAASLALGLLMAWRIDINIFSLYHFYRNRLTRAYLGATRGAARDPQLFTGFDTSDDLAMADLRCERNGKSLYQRPYHIINCALNLAHGQDLAWQTRKAASFVFTPQHCGFELPRADPAVTGAPGGTPERGCYRPASLYMCPDGVRLGAALAISGAAASPNMGYHTSAPLAVLMTIFNVRLGRWCGNPLHHDAWKSRGPSMSALYIMRELFSLTTLDSRFLYLSDGGHFENLGIYELVRRRCRFIVACDAGQDEKFAFDDLGNAIRKCQADFGIEIELDVASIRVQKEAGRSLGYYALGTIHYDQRDAGAQPGKLLYIKPCLTGKEPSDILNYAAINSSFPHQSTSDQWFDEPQFESYRKLGYYIAREIFSGAKARGDIEALFNSLGSKAQS